MDDAVGRLGCGNDAAHVLYHVVNQERFARRPTMIATNGPSEAGGYVLHDADLAEAIADRVLERGWIVTVDGPSYGTRRTEPPIISRPAVSFGSGRQAVPLPTQGVVAMLSHWSRTTTVSLTVALMAAAAFSWTPSAAVAAAPCEPGDSNGDGIVDAGDVSCTILLVFGGHCATECVGASAFAYVPKTGQTVCRQSVSPWSECECGTPDCPAGQDGDLQKGVAWPDPRFTDNGNGTVTDNLTGLVWLKDANCFDESQWALALTKANGLADGACGLTDGSSAGDWRLPNVRELQSLIDHGRYEPSLPSGHPFTAVQSNYYWASTTVAGYPDYAWTVYLYYGLVIDDYKVVNHYVWPVRGGP